MISVNKEKVSQKEKANVKSKVNNYINKNPPAITNGIDIQLPQGRVDR